MIKNYLMFFFALSGLASSSAMIGCESPPEPSPERLQGVVEYDQRMLGFRRPGQIALLHAEESERVEEGQLLAQLDSSLAELTRDMHHAQVNAAQAKLELLSAGARTSDVRARAAELRSARAALSTLQEDLERNERLQAHGAIADAQVSRLRGERDRAQAMVSASSQRLVSLRAGARAEEIAIAAAGLESAEASLQVAEVVLAQHTLTSPLSGVIVSRTSGVGEITGAGSPVFVVADLGHPFVDVFVPQGRMGEVEREAEVDVFVDTREAPLSGRVERLGHEMEYTPRFLFSERERPNLVLRVRIRIDDPDHLLHAGLPAFVRVQPSSGSAD